MIELNGHGLPKLKARENPRRRLFNLNRMCFWCGRLTRLDAKQDAPDLATVDHLYSRLHVRRAKSKNKVLACQECNHARSVADMTRIVFVPGLAHRQEIARTASACMSTSRELEHRAAESVTVLSLKHRTCKHMQIVNVLEAHALRHEVQKITGLRADVRMCGLCGSWRVVITDRVKQSKLDKARALLAQRELPAPEYLN